MKDALHMGESPAYAKLRLKTNISESTPSKLRLNVPLPITNLDLNVDVSDTVFFMLNLFEYFILGNANLDH